MKEKQNKLFTLVVIGQIISLFGNSILRFALALNFSPLVPLMIVTLMILAAAINFALSSMLMVGMPFILTQKLGVSD